MTTQTEALKRFLIGTSVENAEGLQIWYVDATTEKEALRIFNEGGADIYASEVEVTATGTPYIDGCTTLDDFGDFNDKPLAQPEQEQARAQGYKLVPVEPTPEMRKAAADAWLNCGSKMILNKAAAAVKAGINAAPQRTWVGLTDEEFTRIQQETPYTQFMTVSEYALQCQIKHEAKLKEKNNG